MATTATTPAAAFALASALLCSAAAARADTMVRNAGGTLERIDGGALVRLRFEHVRARVFRQDAAVECVYFLENPGDADTVTVGIPDLSSGAVDPHNPPRFEFVEAYADGAPLDIAFDTDEAGRWRAEVVFAAGQTRVLRTRFLSGLGRDSDGRVWFTYRVSPAPSWDGGVPATSIEATLSDFDTGELTSVRPEPDGRDGTGVWWTFTGDDAREAVGLEWRWNANTAIDSDLHRAAAAGDTAAVARLLARGHDVDEAGDFAQTPLRLAVSFGAGASTVAFLLERGADPNRYLKDWDTALHEVARHHHAESAAVARALIEHGARVDATVGRHPRGDTPLMIAVQDECPPEVVSVLIEYGANVNAVGAGGHTVLHRAVLAGSPGKVDLLLQHGAGVNARNDDGRTALDIAPAGEIRELLLDYGAGE